MTPRRSSRARTSQPSPANLPHTNSSSSSASMTRERSTRSNHKISSPQRSSTHRSQSSDDADTGSKNDLPQTRQRRARGDDEHGQPLKPGEEEEEEDDDDEEEEVTRCLCGHQEFPGLPPSRREALGRGGRDEKSSNTTGAPEVVSDDIGGMFIQCDLCKVWQHGGCVGIMDEAMSPDEYFCEECRKDLHKIRGEPNGFPTGSTRSDSYHSPQVALFLEIPRLQPHRQYSSTYLPVAPVSSPPASSRESSRDNDSRRSKNSKRYSDATNPKRRSTMNSRDAAYDEEEQLLRAIEESKEDNKSVTDEGATRRAKRSRSDSEALKKEPKRQRTGSRSPSPAATSKQSNPISQPASEDESKGKAPNGTKKQRATSRNPREKTKEPEEPEAERSERSENGNRRKGRTEQRDDESEHEGGSPAKTAANEPEPSQPSPGTPAPAPAAEPAASRPSTRKSGRPPARRGGRVGRNQYTRDRDMNGNGIDTGLANSPRRGLSHDTGADSPRPGSNGPHVNGGGGESGKPSRPRYMHPQRTTMNEMKRRVAGILEFISRMQVEMAVAGESSSPTGNGNDRLNGASNSGALLKGMLEQLEGATSDGGDSGPPTDAGDPREKDFKELSSVEMMDVLTRHLLKWQQEYGRFGER